MEKNVLIGMNDCKTSKKEESNNLLLCIKKTQEQLGRYVSRPPLLTRYLIRPPFLFFHDIITTIIHTTGFLRGLYCAEELDRVHTRNVKANRISFLSKLIKTLQATTGEKFPRFNLAKMSVGTHPLSVNRVLHSIALALDMNMVSDLAVLKVLGVYSPLNTVQGTKRKIDDVHMDDEEEEYFGDDEAESCNTTLHVKRPPPTVYPEDLNLEENDDQISMAYENDMALQYQYSIEQSLPNLTITVDTMEY